MDLRVASRGGRPSSLITRSTFSTTTMASSTSRPIASTMANMVRVLILKPQAERMAKVPISTTGTAMVGDQRGAEVLQEQVHHQEHQQDGFQQRFHHVP